MKKTARERFDVEALRRLAGAKVFERGEDYFQGEQVQILSLEPARVLAQVSGSEIYRTVLTGRGTTIGGECSCPAVGDSGWCKHLVAVGLAANAAARNGEADGVGALARIRAHLRRKGIDALIEMIVGIAESDPAFFRKLDTTAAPIDTDDKTLLARLRKVVDKATRIDYYIDYRAASEWTAAVDAALDTIAELVTSGRSAPALALADHAIDRIAAAYEQIDDSDGRCGALMARARDIHIDAARAVKPDPVKLARDLFGKEMRDNYGTFGGCVVAYGDVLGKKGRAEYRRLATEAWEKLPKLGPARRGSTSPAGDYHGLSRILDIFLEEDGDLDARIALRAKDLSSPWCYLTLAEFCLEHGRGDEALRRAEEGLWVFEDERVDGGLVQLAAKLLAKAGRQSEAIAHLRRAFETSPNIELYKQLVKLGGREARVLALQFLEQRLTGARNDVWSDPAGLLIDILIGEKEFARAWSVVANHGASTFTRESLAKASETSHPAEALAVYAERVEALLQGSGNLAYEDAARLIARMGRLRDAAAQEAYVAELKERHGRKRNFMKLLA